MDKPKIYEISFKVIIAILILNVILTAVTLIAHDFQNPIMATWTMAISVAFILGLIWRINLFRILLMITVGIKTVAFPITMIGILMGPLEARQEFFTRAAENFFVPISVVGICVFMVVQYLCVVWALVTLKSSYIRDEFRKSVDVAS